MVQFYEWWARFYKGYTDSIESQSYSCKEKIIKKLFVHSCSMKWLYASMLNGMVSSSVVMLTLAKASMMTRSPEATDTLVFMAVMVNSSWKIPCGYFLVNGLTGEKANLTKECITKLHEVGVKVVSFMCNDPTSHQSMLKLIGTQLLPRCGEKQ